MGILKNQKFILLLGMLIILEGLGLPNGRNLAFCLILSTPIFLFSESLLKKRPILIPKKLGFLFLIFLLVTFISVITSQNVQRSFEYFIFYVASVLIFIYTYNSRENLKNSFVWLILGLSIIFCFYSLLISLLPKLIPGDRFFQLVYQGFGHNHLGDFLLLSLTILLYYFVKRNLISVKGIILFLFFTPFFILSFSRSAYLDLAIISAILTYHSTVNFGKKHAVRIGLLLILLVVIGSFFVFTAANIKTPFVKSTNEILRSELNLKSKTFSGKRELYVAQSFLSISDKPIFGVGPGNFYITAEKFAKEFPISPNAHNIILDFFVENGIFAGLVFVIMILMIFKKADRNILTYVALAMFLNFQTDYTYRIVSFFILFSAILGTIYREKEEVSAQKILLIVSFIIFVISVAIFTSKSLYAMGNSKAALLFYPINRYAYANLIKSTPTNDKLIEIYTALFSDKTSHEFLGEIYESKNQPENALVQYEMAYDSIILRNYLLAQRVYELKLKVQGKTSADKFIDSYFAMLSEPNYKVQLSRSLVHASILCKKVHNDTCPFNLLN